MKWFERRVSTLGKFMVLCAALLSASTACRDTAKTDTPAIDASVAPTSSSVSAEIPTITAAAPLPPDDSNDALDAGFDAADGGARRRRRLLATLDAGGLSETPPAVPVAATASSEGSGGKRTPAAMGNDGVYGASAASGAGAFRKTPLPTDDPWKPAPAPTK